MAFNPNQALLGKIGGGTDNYQQSSAQMMQNAQAAMGSQHQVREGNEPTVGSALQGAMGGALTAAGAGATLGAVGLGETAAATFLTGGLGLGIAAGVGLLSSIFG